MEFDMTMLLILAAVAVLTTTMIMTTLSTMATTMQRHNARVDRKLNQIMEHLGMNAADAEMAEVRDLAEQGKIIQAVKRHRELTGSNLKEAKHAVDRLTAGG